MRSMLWVVASLVVVGLISQSAAAQLHVVYSPVVPTVAYQPVAPVQQVVYQPVVQPTTVYYAPAPAPVVASPVVTTRYRPFLGGNITRVRYVYSPVTYAAPAPVTYYYR